MADGPARLDEYPVHLGADGSVAPLPRFTGAGEWYGEYERRFLADGPAGRLVSWHRFDSSWTEWEMHPNGEELVVCLSGPVSFVQEIDGRSRAVSLQAGEWLINPAGVWHTADIAGGDTVVCLFITSGIGTSSRPRSSGTTAHSS